MVVGSGLQEGGGGGNGCRKGGGSNVNTHHNLKYCEDKA